ncbi:hypothetical protein KW795_02290 [Candidatus Microgenomates bacterium]|nr:hypothetical protein [Candidatus Microgenomates bacterium]
MNEQNKILLAIIVTAIVVGSGAYYFLGNKASETISSKQENAIFSQSSKEYAIMGRQTWSAFECSALASHIDKATEAERLFMYGYEQGKKFLEALRAEKIDEKDISQEVPIGLTLLLGGPSEDFMLGRIYSSAEEETLNEVFKTGNDFNSDEIQKMIAENKFRDRNCQLIGKN